MTTILRLLGALTFFSTLVSAASLSGRVFDPQRLPAVDARVTLLQPDTGQRWSTSASSDGGYRFEGLGAGRYLLTVEFEGLLAPPREISLSPAAEALEESVTLALDRVRTEVVVTASASAVSADSISRALDVTRKSDWEARGVSTLSEAVQQTPGLRVQSLGGPGGFTRVLLRGLPAQDTAVTVDGLRFRDAATTQGDASSFLENLMLADSQRVEVLRGSGSALRKSRPARAIHSPEPRRANRSLPRTRRLHTRGPSAKDRSAVSIPLPIATTYCERDPVHPAHPRHWCAATPP